MPNKPSFYKKAIDDGIFADQNERVKFIESLNFWIFKSGKIVYKVKKRDLSQNNLAVDELFCRNLANTISAYSPQLDPKVLTLTKNNDLIEVTEQAQSQSEIFAYIVAMNQISETAFLDAILKKNRATEKTVGNIAKYLYELHNSAETISTGQEGNVEQLTRELDDLIYQSKKHLGKTISQAVLDMTRHPMEKFLQDHKKLFNKRSRKGFVRKIHGAFIPSKIIIQKGQVFALGQSFDPVRSGAADIVSDIADLVVELNYTKNIDLAEHFTQSYIKLSNDREIKQLLPFYKAMKCLERGLKNSTLAITAPAKKATIHCESAVKYYEQTVEAVHQF